MLRKFVIAAGAAIGFLSVAPTASAALITLDDVTLPGDPIQIVNGVNDGDANFGAPPANENVERAIDNTTTKYLNFLDLGSGFIVTPSRGPSVINGIRLYSANDAAERDPGSFWIEGANSPTGPFTLIAASNVTLGARNAANLPIEPNGANTLNSVTYMFANQAQYSSYRVTFPTLANSQTATSMQIGEVELLGTIIPEPATLGLVSIAALGLLRRRR